MSAWLDPVRCVLDARATPVTVFLRDDDAGWDDAGLARLLDVCAAHAAPIDVAVIPAAIDALRAEWLLARRDGHPARLGLHQHGWAHDNHEPDTTRKCEFGPARTLDALRADVSRGREVMTRMLGGSHDAVFTPPWNRCVPALGPVLAELGFTVLSRDVTAPPLQTHGLRECPTHVDWSSRRRGARLTLEERAAGCARLFATEPVVGLLFHHAVMDDDTLQRVGELLATLAGHPAVWFASLLDAAAALAIQREIERPSVVRPA